MKIIITTLFGLESPTKGDLLDRLVREVGERNTPEWLIRQRYARELEAAGSIDNLFPDKGYSAQGIIEISKSFNVDAQVIGHVEASPTAQVTVSTENGTFVYNS